jgi:hypothetical protein
MHLIIPPESHRVDKAVAHRLLVAVDNDFTADYQLVDRSGEQLSLPFCNADDASTRNNHIET